jgi:hypothetical protein
MGFTIISGRSYKKEGKATPTTHLKSIQLFNNNNAFCKPVSNAAGILFVVAI